LAAADLPGLSIHSAETARRVDLSIPSRTSSTALKSASLPATGQPARHSLERPKRERPDCAQSGESGG
jgi:hypothetical protein